MMGLYRRPERSQQPVAVAASRSIGGPRIRLACLLAGILAIAGLFMAAGPLPAANAHQPAASPEDLSALVRCEPDPLSAMLGSTASVTIYVQDVAELYGLDVRLQFDPAFVQVVDADPATPGVQIQPLGGFLSPDFVVRRSADNVTGMIRYAVTQVAPSQPVTGSGAVARIELQGIQPGIISVPFTQVELARSNGSSIAATTQACTWQFSQPRLHYLPLVAIR